MQQVLMGIHRQARGRRTKQRYWEHEGRGVVGEGEPGHEAETADPLPRRPQELASLPGATVKASDKPTRSPSR